MATYTVNITGTFNQTYGYLTINGTKITTAGTRTYSSKPTIKAFVSSSQSNLRSKCYVSHNGTVLKSGYGEYTLAIDAETMDLKMLQIQDASTYLYYAVEVTTAVPAEPHNTNIGGNAREIESCTVLVGGVLREVESGLVLVNGVAREIVFVQDKALITITGTGDTTRCYATIGGTKHTGEVTVEVDPGTVITLYINASSSSGAIEINGSQVIAVSGTYSYVVEKNVEIELEYKRTRHNNAYRYYAYIYVTEL